MQRRIAILSTLKTIVHSAWVLSAVALLLAAAPIAALADCGPGSPPDCTCILPGEVIQIESWTLPELSNLALIQAPAIQPIGSAGTLRVESVNLYTGVSTVLVSTAVEFAPIPTPIAPVPVSSFVPSSVTPLSVGSLYLPVATNWQLPTHAFSPAGVLEYNGSTFFNGTLSFHMSPSPGLVSSAPAGIPEPSTIFLATLLAISCVGRRTNCLR